MPKSEILRTYWQHGWGGDLTTTIGSRTGTNRHAVWVWARDKKQVDNLLRAVFPGAYRLPPHREELRRAKRWEAVVNLYGVCGWGETDIATHLLAEYKIRTTPGAIKSLVRSIRRAHGGLTANHAVPRAGCRGPRK